LKYITGIIFLSLLFFRAEAQNCNITITGHVENAETHELLAGATIRVLELNSLYTTDEKGDFIITGLCEGVYNIEISHIGCETLKERIVVNRSRHFDFHLHHNKEALEEVVVSGIKTENISGYNEKLSGRNLEQYRGLSVSEALAAINGVTLLQTGSTISKPVIHGLHGSRVLTINNGVRQEAQQWGNEHAPEIDPFIAENLSVVKGVEGLRYGSDAIAGVVLVEPKILKFSEKPVGEFTAGYFTNNGQYVAAGNIESRIKKFPELAFRLQGSLKKAANIQTPDYRLNNTGQDERNFSVLTGWKKSSYSLEAYYSRFQNTTGIFTGSHIGNLTDLLAAIEAPKPDEVYLGENTYIIGRPRQEAIHHLLKLRGNYYKGENKFQLTLAMQDNTRKEFDITRSIEDKSPQQELQLLSFSEDLSWEHPSFGGMKGSAGISFSQKQQWAYGRYFIPNYQAFSAGGYIIEGWKSGNFYLQGGVRADYKTLSTSRLRYNNSEINHDFNFTTVAGSANAQYQFNQNLKANIMLVLSGRAPDVNELLSDGIHHGTASYEKGDIHLKVEKSFQAGVGVDYQSDNGVLGISFFGYNNSIRDFIYRKPVPGQPVLTVAGAYPLIVYAQTNAGLTGMDFALKLKPEGVFNFESKASILRAKDTKAKDWLILMPSDRFTQNLVFNLKNSNRFVNNYISLEFASVLKQTRIPQKLSGEVDYKLPPDAYHLTNLHASTSFKVSHIPVVLSAGVNNLFNVSYREYLNSFRYFTDDMGRNFVIRFKIIFDKNISTDH
jgi:iron complex outermembrane receptor protein